MPTRLFASLGLAVVVSSLGCALTPAVEDAPSTDGTRSSKAQPLTSSAVAPVDFEAPAECDSLMGQMFFYDLALQSAIARGCTNAHEVEQLSVTLIDLGRVAYPTCVRAYGIDASWFGDWWHRTLDGWHAQNDCLQADPIAQRSPLTALNKDDLFCHKSENITAYTRVCADPAERRGIGTAKGSWM